MWENKLMGSNILGPGLHYIGAPSCQKKCFLFYFWSWITVNWRFLVHLVDPYVSHVTWPTKPGFFFSSFLFFFFFIPSKILKNKLLRLQYIGAWLQYILAPKSSWLDPQWKDLKVNNKSGIEWCWRKLRAEMDLLLKGEEDVRDKVDAPKPNRRLLDINESDDESDGGSAMDELTRSWNFNIC